MCTTNSKDQKYIEDEADTKETMKNEMKRNEMKES